MADLSNAELDAICKRVTTWDQAELDRLVGRPAIAYAQAHEDDVRFLAREMWSVFPLGPRWWKIQHALANVFAKNAAIKERAAQIGRDRAAGLIIETFRGLEYRS
jgi:hypothetical protein